MALRPSHWLRRFTKPARTCPSTVFLYGRKLINQVEIVSRFQRTIDAGRNHSAAYISGFTLALTTPVSRQEQTNRYHCRVAHHLEKTSNEHHRQQITAKKLLGAIGKITRCRWNHSAPLPMVFIVFQERSGVGQEPPPLSKLRCICVLVIAVLHEHRTI